MTDLYAVIGQPIAHSLSPHIHTLFAVQTQQDLQYTRYLATPETFGELLTDLAHKGYRGVNITLPFKRMAFELCHEKTPRSLAAGTVNTICFEGIHDWRGDNTDGAGLIHDLTERHHCDLQNKTVLIMGAGGASQGIIPSLLKHPLKKLVLTNRTLARAQDLAKTYAPLGPVESADWQTLNALQVDVIIHTTSIGHEHSAHASLPNLSPQPQAVCYDLSYGAAHQRFAVWASALNPLWIADGLGMLVEQAAESFYLWRGIRPDNDSVLTSLRNQRSSS